MLEIKSDEHLRSVRCVSVKTEGQRVEAPNEEEGGCGSLEHECHHEGTLIREEGWDKLATLGFRSFQGSFMDYPQAGMLCLMHQVLVIKVLCGSIHLNFYNRQGVSYCNFCCIDDNTEI